MAKSNLSKHSVSDLHRELRRRSRAAVGLQRKRNTLMRKIEALDAQLREIGASTGGGMGGGRKRPRNESNLTETLVKSLTGKTMGVNEVAEYVQKQGYQTTSPNFRTIVNQALIRDKRFKRVGRGQYTVKS